MLLYTLSACLLITDDEHADRLGEVPRVDAVDPPYGTDVGGSIVTVRGSGFTDDAEVRFGAAVGDVQSVQADAIAVRVPASAELGLVDVTVSTDGGEDVAQGAFRYWADATGQVSVTGEFVQFFYVGGYWDTSTKTDYARSTLRFVEPLDYQFYRNWSPALDTCVRITDGVAEYVYEPGFVAIDAVGGTVTQTGPATSVALDWNAAEVRYQTVDLPAGELVPGDTYDLSVRGSSVIPDFDLPGVFRVPSHFDVTDPDIFGENLPPVSRLQHFGWSTADETGDVALLQLGLVNAAGDGFEQELYCALSDVGSFTLTNGMFTRWAADRFINILIGRYNTGDGVLPFNNGQIGVASTIWYYGGGRTE